MKVLLSLVLKTWPRSFMDCWNQLGSLKFLFLIHCNCRDCPKESCITWFVFFAFLFWYRHFLRNLCTLSFLTKLCPHWILSSAAEISILAAAAHLNTVAIAVYIFPYSYLIWSHLSSWLGTAKRYISFFHSNCSVTYRWCLFPPGWSCKVAMYSQDITCALMKYALVFSLLPFFWKDTISDR